MGIVITTVCCIGAFAMNLLCSSLLTHPGGTYHLYLGWGPLADCAFAIAPTHCQLVDEMLLQILSAVLLCASGSLAVAVGYEDCPGFRHYFNISDDYDGSVPDSIVTGRPTTVTISYFINRLKFVSEAK